MEPSTNGANGATGRDAGGRFVRGNPGGPGSPHARRVARLRAALLRAVSPQDIDTIVKKLVAQAKAGDVASIKELLQRVLGPAVEVDLIERLEQLEHHFSLHKHARK